MYILVLDFLLKQLNQGNEGSKTSDMGCFGPHSHATFFGNDKRSSMQCIGNGRITFSSFGYAILNFCVRICE